MLLPWQSGQATPSWAAMALRMKALLLGSLLSRSASSASTLKATTVLGDLLDIVRSPDAGPYEMIVPRRSATSKRRGEAIPVRACGVELFVPSRSSALRDHPLRAQLGDLLRPQPAQLPQHLRRMLPDTGRVRSGPAGVVTVDVEGTPDEFDRLAVRI